MKHTTSRLAAALLVTTTLAAAVATGAIAQDQKAVQFDLASQSLSQSLREFSQVSGQQIVFSEDVVRGVQAPPVHGTHTPQQALSILLADTGLIAERARAGAIMVKRKNEKSSGARERHGAAYAIDVAAVASKSLTQTAQAGTAASRSEESVARIEEVIVTAQKRAERIQDVPIPVTAISPQTLLDSHELRLQDYAGRIPGLSVTPGAQAITNIAIRGITTGIGPNPTVGISIDDVPFGPGTAFGGGGTTPDLDPGDLQRIEVLRGPQGTLYGASSLGGLIKYVTTDPSTDGLSGRLQADFNGVTDSSDIGYGLRGSVNVPVGETLALRVSGFGRRVPGYIDDPVRGAHDVNSGDVYGGRLSALWLMSDDISLKLSGLNQRSKADGSSDADPALGDLNQRRVAQTGAYDRRVEAYSAVLAAGVDNTQLTSLTGYNISKMRNVLDGGFAYGGLVNPIFSVTSATLVDQFEATRFSQEFRVSAQLGERVDWLVGAFYSNENSDYFNDVAAISPTTGASLGSLRNGNVLSSLREYAGFTDLTFTVTDRFDVQVGARVADIQQTYTPQAQRGPGALAVDPPAAASATAVTYLLTPRFKISSDVMVYGRIASGYRPGGTNGNAGPGTPPQYNPDKTRNYEVGVKGDLIDHKLSVDVSAYYIDWKNLQILVLNPVTVRSFRTNASRAKSQGLELSVNVFPWDSMEIVASAAWNDAELTEDFPPTTALLGQARKGDRLPNSSRFTSNLSLNQEFPVARSMTGTVGGSVNYVGGRLGVFRAGPRQVFSDYTTVELHAGLAYETWKANLFVTNLGDERGIVYGGLGSFPPTAFTYIQPRTFGLSLTKSF